MNVREFAEMLLKLPDQEAIVRVSDAGEFVDFSGDVSDGHIEYFSYQKFTGVAATSSWYMRNCLNIGPASTECPY